MLASLCVFSCLWMTVCVFWTWVRVVAALWILAVPPLCIFIFFFGLSAIVYLVQWLCSLYPVFIQKALWYFLYFSDTKTEFRLWTHESLKKPLLDQRRWNALFSFTCLYSLSEHNVFRWPCSVIFLSMLTASLGLHLGGWLFLKNPAMPHIFMFLSFNHTRICSPRVKVALLLPRLLTC